MICQSKIERMFFTEDKFCTYFYYAISAIKKCRFFLIFSVFSGILNPYDSLELHFIMEVHIIAGLQSLLPDPPHCHPQQHREPGVDQIQMFTLHCTAKQYKEQQNQILLIFSAISINDRNHKECKYDYSNHHAQMQCEISE